MHEVTPELTGSRHAESVVRLLWSALSAVPDAYCNAALNYCDAPDAIPRASQASTCHLRRSRGRNSWAANELACAYCLI